MSTEKKNLTACLDNLIKGLEHLRDRAIELGANTADMTVAAVHKDAAGIEHMYAVDYIAATMDQCYLRIVPVEFPVIEHTAVDMGADDASVDADEDDADTVTDKKRLN